MPVTEYVRSKSDEPWGKYSFDNVIMYFGWLNLQKITVHIFHDDKSQLKVKS